MNTNTNVSENGKETEYANMQTLLVNDAELQKKIDESKVMYPVIKFTNKGETLIGMLIDVVEFPQLNEGKGSILLNLKVNEQIVAYWLNTVAKSQIIRLVGEKQLSTRTFEEEVSIIRKALGKSLIIRYEGEQKSTKKGYKPYQNYTIIENV